MHPTPTLPPVQASAPDIARRVALIVAGLAALVAHRFLRDPHFARLTVPLWTRLTHAAARFGRLMAVLAADRAPKPRRPSPPHRKAPGTARPALFPAAHGWLLRAIPYEAAGYASQLEFLLAEPATVALLAAHPAAARILRPLARMLGICALAPKRIRPKRRSEPPSGAPPSPRIKPPPPFARHPPNADWPHRPSADWASAYRRRRAKPA